MIHVTGTTAVPIPPCAGIELKINTALTGTYTILDGLGNTVSVITNPTVGGSYTYYGLQPGSATNGGSVTASAIGDATINILSRTMA
jgi:hypothetical protein